MRGYLFFPFLFQRIGYSPGHRRQAHRVTSPGHHVSKRQ